MRLDAIREEVIKKDCDLITNWGLRSGMTAAQVDFAMTALLRPTPQHYGDLIFEPKMNNSSRI